MSHREEIHQGRDGPQEEIVQLKVCIAVLENELNIKIKEAAEAERCIVLMAKAFIAHPPNPSIPDISTAGQKANREYAQGHDEENSAYLREQVRIMEKEIEDLRRHNKGYREKLKKSLQIHSGIPPAPTRFQPGEGQPTNTSIPAKGFEAHTPQGHFERPLFSLAAFNSPLLPANYSAGVANVGIISLDDELGPEEEDTFNTPTPAPKRNATGLGPERMAVTPHDLLGAAYDAGVHKPSPGSTQQFQHGPAPTVLKTGFELNGSYRGRTYEVGGSSANSEDEFSRQIVAQGGLAQSRYARPEDNFPSGSRVSRPGKERVSFDQSRIPYGQAPRDFNAVNYVPSKEDTNYIRTVHIGNLPKTIHLRDVLTRVRGGEIVSAVLADTSSITGSLTAIIEFVLEAAAEDYVRFTALHPITFGEDDDKVTAEVTLIHTPTYPIIDPVNPNLLFNGYRARCFYIRNFPKYSSARDIQNRILGNNSHRANCLLDVYFDEERNLHFQFSSQLAARQAKGAIFHWGGSRGLDIQREADPCAGRIEELLLDVPMRNPFFPKAGFVDERREAEQEVVGHKIEVDDESPGDEVAPVRASQNPDEIDLE